MKSTLLTSRVRWMSARALMTTITDITRTRGTSWGSLKKRLKGTATSTIAATITRLTARLKMNAVL